jgi:hypothetical protein
MYKLLEGTRFHLVDLTLKWDKRQGIRTKKNARKNVS